MLLTILSFAVVAGLIITIHEFGHFTAARLTGMRVKKFSIGFPPKAFSRQIGNTEFSLSWIPLGGYVQIAGMVDESLDPDGITGAPDEFMSKNVFQKVFVLSAGVLMNYLTAFVIMIGLTLVVGVPEFGSAQIGEVIENRPAAEAGVLDGDLIIEVDGTPIADWEDVITTISSAGDSIRMKLMRGDTEEIVELTVITELVDEGGTERRMIGIGPAVEFRSAGAVEAIGRSASFCYLTTANLLKFVGDMIRGEGSISQLSGPVGVARLSGESARQGPAAFLFFIAFVSVSIGFLNILPLPVLDGGHIVFVVIETIIRRPIPTKIKLTIQQVGVIALILLVLVVSYHDILRIFPD